MRLHEALKRYDCIAYPLPFLAQIREHFQKVHVEMVVQYEL
jgi:hypothetical protein